MGASASCFYLCEDEPQWNSGHGQDSARWCVGDSAEAQFPVFVPDAGRDKFVVVGLEGASLRETNQLHSPILKTLPQRTIVLVSEIKGRRAHIMKPVDGWASLTTEDGYVIIEALERARKYKVVYEGGCVIRSGRRIEDGEVVRVAPVGAILKATGKTEIIDGVERVQVEGGWASMRLREDARQGARLLEALD